MGPGCISQAPIRAMSVACVAGVERVGRGVRRAREVGARSWEGMRRSWAGVPVLPPADRISRSLLPPLSTPVTQATMSAERDRDRARVRERKFFGPLPRAHLANERLLAG